MRQLSDLMQDIIDNGIKQSNRTGIDTITIPGAMLRFDLRDGFPAVTTKKLAFKSVVGELIGFLKGFSSAKDFRDLGCNIWDQNANENKDWLANPNRKGEDDLGRVYGVQWRDLLVQSKSGTRTSIDQIETALNLVRNNPHNRRIIVNAWNPGEFDQMALPPCHVLFQLLPHVDHKVLHMTMYQRSVDTFIGLPFNIASYALLLELFAKWTGYTAGTLTMFLADTHLYENHLDQVNLQMQRLPFELPKLVLDLPKDCATMSLDALLASLKPEDIRLTGYASHAAIQATMAV